MTIAWFLDRKSGEWKPWLPGISLPACDHVDVVICDVSEGEKVSSIDVFNGRG